METQFVFLFLLRAVFGELFNEWTSKTLSVIVQDKIDNKFPSSILLSIIEMTPKICSETIRLLMMVLLECRPWKFVFDFYKGREKSTLFFRKAKKNSSKRFPSAGVRIQLSSCWLVPGLLCPLLLVLSSIPIYDFRSLFDFCPFRVGTEIPVKLNVALVERERERCGRGDKMTATSASGFLFI